jgi:tetratricopeptide (TPR) repeat protein
LGVELGSLQPARIGAVRRGPGSASSRVAHATSRAAKRWLNAAVQGSNLSQAELLTGEVAVAVISAARSVDDADRGGDAFQMMISRAVQADAQHAAGRRADAEALLVDAERRQRERQPQYPLLYSVQGYHYCDLLLAKGEWAAARDRAQKILEWEVEDDSLLDRSLVRLSLGRAYLGLSLNIASVPPTSAIDTARVRLEQAINGLREAGTSDLLPGGLLARAGFRRSTGDWDRATRDLDEVEEIAEPGPMKLWLCDLALERARLALAKIEAFAPLHGMIDGGPPKPVPPDEAERKSLHDEAAKQLAIAADSIATCGYHKRDEELAELQAVLRGETAFAELPPRV